MTFTLSAIFDQVLSYNIFRLTFASIFNLNEFTLISYLRENKIVYILFNYKRVTNTIKLQYERIAQKVSVVTKELPPQSYAIYILKL